MSPWACAKGGPPRGPRRLCRRAGASGERALDRSRREHAPDAVRRRACPTGSAPARPPVTDPPLRHRSLHALTGPDRTRNAICAPSEARPSTGPSLRGCGEAAPRRRSRGCHPRDAVSNAVRNATRNTIRDTSVTMGATPFRAEGDPGPNRDSAALRTRGGRVDGPSAPRRNPLLRLGRSRCCASWPRSTATTRHWDGRGRGSRHNGGRAVRGDDDDRVGSGTLWHHHRVGQPAHDGRVSLRVGRADQRADGFDRVERVAAIAGPAPGACGVVGARYG